MSLDNTIENLRELLFTQIRRLNTADLKNLGDEIKRANATSHAAQTIINSAAIECEYMRLTGSMGSGFIPVVENPVRKSNPRLIVGDKK